MIMCDEMLNGEAMEIISYKLDRLNKFFEQIVFFFRKRFR